MAQVVMSILGSRVKALCKTGDSQGQDNQDGAGARTSIALLPSVTVGRYKSNAG